MYIYVHTGTYACNKISTYLDAMHVTISVCLSLLLTQFHFHIILIITGAVSRSHFWLLLELPSQVQYCSVSMLLAGD